MCINDSSRHCSKTWGELNVFQRVMRQWTDLHPYNAVHVFRFEGRADIDRLTDSIRHAWQALDFGMVSIQKHQYRFWYPEQERPEVEFLSNAGASTSSFKEAAEELRSSAASTPMEPEDNHASALDAHLSDLLNRRFPVQDYAPIRFSVLQEAACHYLCVTYDHWIADGMAMRVLLRPVIRNYCGDPGQPLPDAEGLADLAKDVSFYPPTYRLAYRKYFSAKTKRLSQWWRGILANNVTILAPSRENNNMHVECLSRDLPDEAMRTIVARAKQHGVTVHDLFLAAITRACMPHLPERLVRRKRRRMGMGSIVDTRGLADVDVGRAFGVYLGYFITHTRADSADTLEGLARVIAERTRIIKTDRAYLNTAIGMKMQCWLWPLIPRFAKPGFLRNSLPLSAGITNTRVKDDWMIGLGDSSPRRLLGYFRAAPTGPILPISFAPTTMGDSLRISITWRPSCFDRATIKEIASRIENDLSSR
ncbi:MAG TPA: hypothetical protein DD670_18365 [Planctomycetaceae bacterium]|nr:hypothetical protein [Planctomycetaceae bacterium]